MNNEAYVVRDHSFPGTLEIGLVWSIRTYEKVSKVQKIPSVPLMTANFSLLHTINLKMWHPQNQYRKYVAMWPPK